MIVRFSAYLHDGYEGYERSESIRSQLEQQGIDTSQWDWEELEQKMGKPFYEVKLSCTLDTDTGKVEILKAERT